MRLLAAGVVGGVVAGVTAVGTLRATPLIPEVYPSGAIMIYGDSYNNEGELLPYLSQVGIHTVWSIAHSGARTYDDASRCDAADGYTDCEDFGTRQVKYLDGACRVTGELWSTDNPSCMQDAFFSAQQMCVIQFGVNDVFRSVAGGGSHTDWEATHFVLAQAAFEEMLHEADALGIRCLVVTSFPVGEGSHPEWEELNENLHDLRDWQRDVLMPAHPDQGFLDLVAVVDAYRIQNGDNATNDLYQNGDGIHPGTVPNALGDTGRAIAGMQVANALVTLYAKPVPTNYWVSVVVIEIAATLVFAWTSRQRARVGTRDVTRDDRRVQ